MKRLAKLLPSGLVLLGIALAGCGERTWSDLRDPLHLGADRSEGDGAASPQPGPTTGPAAGQGPGSSGTGGAPPPSAHAPVETYLEGGMRMPFRLKADRLAVRFRSNFADVTFECAESMTVTSPLVPCSGEVGHDFGRLVHGQAYVLRVRAVRADGRRDETPLVIGFVADLFAGGSVLLRGSDVPLLPDAAAALPAPTGEGPRLMQVGSFYGVRAPSSYLVTSYASTKNFNDALISFRLTDRPELTSVNGTRPCEASYEQPATGPNALTYCEATPTRSQWTEDFGVPMPLNHLEIVRAGGTQAEDGAASEKLLVAAYDVAEDDVTEGRLGIGETCRTAVSRGETLVPLVYGFYEAMPTKVPFTWCQVRDRQGRSWWVGAFDTVNPGSGEGSGGESQGRPRLSVVYTADAQLGIYSGNQFAMRAGNFIAPVLVPIAPTPDP